MNSGILFPVDPEIKAVGWNFPYGIVWPVLNFPILLGWELAWEIELIVIWIGISLTLFLHSHRSLGIFFCGLGYVLLWGNMAQGLTSLAWMFLSVYHPGFLILSIMDKLPLGWSLTLNDAHIQMARSFGLIWEPTRIFRYGIMLTGWITSAGIWILHFANRMLGK